MTCSMAVYSETLQKLLDGEDVDATTFRSFAMAVRSDSNRRTEVIAGPENGVVLKIFCETPFALLAEVPITEQQARIFGYRATP